MIDLIAALLDGIAGFFVSLGFSDPAKKPRPTPKRWIQGTSATFPK
jgi:hypothetical protein